MGSGETGLTSKTGNMFGRHQELQQPNEMNHARIDRGPEKRYILKMLSIGLLDRDGSRELINCYKRICRQQRISIERKGSSSQ